MKLALLVGYDGRNFSGSQYQPDVRTVEGEFIKAGISCGAWSDAKSASFRTAGRTDKGVSVRRQLISVTTDFPKRFCEAINFHLPPDIWCLGSTEADDEFYPRYAAESRTYRYYFPFPLDIERMNETASVFVGTKDFSGFSRMEKGRDPIRTVIRAEVFEEGGLPVFEVCAKSFLWNMVRGMAGFLIPVGMGMAGPADAEAQIERHIWRVHPAAAEGLVLWDFACGLSFTPMRQRDEVSRQLFSAAEKSRQEALVAEALLGCRREELFSDAVFRNYGSLLKKRG
ncbi:MAG: tRNA pseudouridine(38-40) synthase TruA [Methanocorpusculum sp.]|nr:tRNA pseudouridine(38-40) synthase TruA [Methanocorpusculum sp.]